ncbi:GH25 family lysozyme [Paracoccus sp. 1_MG-2023]|uniref:glycoside hydrolase family 25 protein n=1 Tax=unclassified Paracoccus (in: a-proteobacteria) TaxID=2688777 RepID=UPI001C0A0192|nr:MULTISPECIES: GH25 family lysozyme [unclassified Paracoccus (in: a-proteobacteria)]MBU2958158.1 glycoside hydrolase family 25 protein [Paracoccus sp. C2R09]MDO6668285.1 GH25 family lysozyme [Paracoccus sp. 1_MG-2023]
MRLLGKLLVACMALAIVASCSRTPPSGGYRNAPGPGANSQLGDRAPHSWDYAAPYGHQVHGIDISRWQGDIDWNRVRGAGISFAFIKATEGGDHLDPNFHRYWREAGQARIPRGAYHFYYFCRSGAENAAWFIRNVPREAGSLPPVLDMEWSHSKTCPRRPSASEIKREAEVFLQLVGRHYGQRPIIYTTVDFYRDNQMGDMRAEFWLRSVANHPSRIYPGQRWGFWQYTGTGIVPGIKGDTDLNAFAGSATDWARWLQTRMVR